MKKKCKHGIITHWKTLNIDIRYCVICGSIKDLKTDKYWRKPRILKYPKLLKEYI